MQRSRINPRKTEMAERKNADGSKRVAIPFNCRLCMSELSTERRGGRRNFSRYFRGMKANSRFGRGNLAILTIAEDRETIVKSRRHPRIRQCFRSGRISQYAGKTGISWSEIDD